MTGQQLHALAQRRDPGLLAQGHGHGAAHGIKGLLHAARALEHLHHVQAKPAVHKPGQHADFNMTEQLACKFRRAVCGTEPTQLTTLLAAGAI